MATPIFNSLDQRLSRMVRDDVYYTTAATDGKVWSAASRASFINRANIFIQQTIWGQCLALYGDTENARNAVRRILQSLVKTSGTLAQAVDNGWTLPSDYGGIPIALMKSGSTSSFVYRANRQDLINNIDINVRHAFAVESKEVYTYENGAAMVSGVVNLVYVCTDQVTQNSSTDILLAAEFHDPLVDLAAWYALTETPKPDVAESKTFYDRAMAFLGRFK